MLEDVPQPLLGLAVELAHDLRSADGHEVGVRLARHGLGQKGLARSGRAVKQHALGRLHAQPLEQFRMPQRQFDHLADALDLVPEAADVLVRHLRDVGDAFLDRLLADLDLSGPVHQHRVRRWSVGHDDQVDPASHDVDLYDIAAGDGAPLQALAEELLPAHDAQRLGGGEGDLPSLLDRHFANSDLLVDAGLSVAADGPVDPDDAAVGVLGIAGPHDGHRSLLPLYLDNVAGGDPENVHDRWIYPSDASLGVLGLGLGDLQYLL